MAHTHKRKFEPSCGHNNCKRMHGLICREEYGLKCGSVLELMNVPTQAPAPIQARTQARTQAPIETPIRDRITSKLNRRQHSEFDTWLALVPHATMCTGNRCSSIQCKSLQVVLLHSKEEKCLQQHCKKCFKLKKLIILHAESCTNINCIVSNCGITRTRIVHSRTCTNIDCIFPNCQDIKNMVNAQSSFVYIPLLPTSIFN